MPLTNLLCTTIVSIFAATTLLAQPHMIRVNSSFQPADGSPASTVENARLAVYANQFGGTPLWRRCRTSP